MAESKLGTTVAAAGTVTLFLTEVLGIDAISLAWGFAGGLVGQIGNEYNNKWRAFLMVIAGALTAGALSTLLVHWIQLYSPSLPLVPLKVLVAFTVGVTWSSIVKGFKSAIPLAIKEFLVGVARLLVRAPAVPPVSPPRSPYDGPPSGEPPRYSRDDDHRPPGA